jgi:hypothetical protein
MGFDIDPNRLWNASETSERGGSQWDGFGEDTLAQIWG